MIIDRKSHWDNVYVTKNPDQVSWTQDVPETSLEFIKSFQLDKSAKIIDIGGGDSTLVDVLIDEGYTDITVLDISEKSIEKAKKRLGNKANNVTWIVTDITEFKPLKSYDIWHDRAAFHFLTTSQQIEAYVKIARNCVTGYMVIGTFSKQGPQKCSGLDIKQYNENELSTTLQDGFDKLSCRTEDHITPFGTIQNFLFCSFKKS